MNTRSIEVSNTALDSPRTIEHVFGLRRSGHHAVVEWLKACHEAAGERPHHENSVYNFHLEPFKPHWADPEPATVWERGRGFSTLIISYEDVDPDERVSSPTYSTLQPPAFGQSARDTFVVRDWFNFVASRLKYQANNAERGRHNSLIFGLEWPEVEERWMKYARLALSGVSEGVIAVNYNEWFINPEYREMLARLYGLPNTESKIDVVPDYGSGSSFDGRELHGQARNMNVLQRWENLDPALLSRYLRLTSNHEFAEINQQLFGINQDEVLASVQRRRDTFISV